MVVWLIVASQLRGLRPLRSIRVISRERLGISASHKHPPLTPIGILCLILTINKQSRAFISFINSILYTHYISFHLYLSISNLRLQSYGFICISIFQINTTYIQYIYIRRCAGKTSKGPCSIYIYLTSWNIWLIWNYVG